MGKGSVERERWGVVSSLFSRLSHLLDLHLTNLTRAPAKASQTQASGCLFPVPLTDRIFIACLKHSELDGWSLARLFHLRKRNKVQHSWLARTQKSTQILALVMSKHPRRFVATVLEIWSVCRCCTVILSLFQCIMSAGGLWRDSSSVWRSHLGFVPRLLGT